MLRKHLESLPPEGVLMKKNDIPSRSSLQNCLVDSDHYLARALLDFASRASSKNLVTCFQNAALSALQPMVIHLQTDLLGPGQTPVTYRRVAAVVVRVAAVVVRVADANKNSGDRAQWHVQSWPHLMRLKN